MTNTEIALQRNGQPRDLAQAVLNDYFIGKQVTYPINPFQMLTDFGVPFVFRTFSKKCEGIYIPAQGEDDIAIVGINIKRPIIRQRYTAAHELCHHIKDSRSSQICNSDDSKNPVEQYAEKFAAELLMPFSEMKRQILKYEANGYISFDDVLMISEYFGVSFLSCLYRSAYVYEKIAGDTDSRVLSKAAAKYQADRKRFERGFTYRHLYEQLINAGENWFKLTPSEFIKNKYCNEYIYNDSRLEGIELESSKIAEIVTDIRLHGRESQYCTEAHEKEIDIAGHAVMYEKIFSMPETQKTSIYTLLALNYELYSCAPCPESGGKLRQMNTLVTGAKFDTLDYTRIPDAITGLAPTVNEIINGCNDASLSEYIEKLSVLHHELTVIHPFRDGNGRTTRAFYNILLMQKGVLPIYIKANEKEEYTDALARADSESNYDDLFIVFFKAILRAQEELTESPLL